jgi:hypothetical protein
MSDYRFEPLTVAATIICRSELELALKVGEGILQVGPGSSPLFRLRLGPPATLWSPFGEAAIHQAIPEAAPDPLWESAAGICAHMEDDHADTFPTFLAMIGRAAARPTGMPWVDSQGFFLSTEDGYAFLPFPTPCLDANSVRASLIKMLRSARAAKR